MDKVLVNKGRGKEILLRDASLFKLHRYLFVFSHCRSFSSLLCHILGSHRQISGYSETLLSYETAVDLYVLNAKVCESGNYKNDCEYVLDKLLYNFLPVSDIVLGLPRVTPIFVVREPEPAIASLARMRVREYELGLGAWPDGSDRLAAARRAAEYYTSRIETLQTLCGRLEALGGRGILLVARCLLDDTAGTLRFLEVELNLDGPLREEYTIFDRTGKPGHGDTSAKIRAGHIVTEPSDQEEIPIPADLLERARVAYTACMNSLRESSALVQYPRADCPL